MLSSVPAATVCESFVDGQEVQGVTEVDHLSTQSKSTESHDLKHHTLYKQAHQIFIVVVFGVRSVHSNLLCGHSE